MAATVAVDAGFLVALVSDRDTYHHWAYGVSEQHPPPWKTCEGVLSETFLLLARPGATTLIELLRRGAVVPAFHLEENADAVLRLMQKYANVPMSLADACLVRMTELLPDPILLTTDADFRIYRRHSRQTVPCMLPD